MVRGCVSQLRYGLVCESSVVGGWTLEDNGETLDDVLLFQLNPSIFFPSTRINVYDRKE